MIDIKLIRDQRDVVQKAARDKGVDIDVTHFLEIDVKYQELSAVVQKKREERNAFTETIQGKPTPEQVEQLLSAVFDADEKKQALAEGRLLTKGIDASPGAAVGEVVFDAKRAEERAKELKDGEIVILF